MAEKMGKKGEGNNKNYKGHSQRDALIADLYKLSARCLKMKC